MSFFTSLTTEGRKITSKASPSPNLVTRQSWLPLHNSHILLALWDLSKMTRKERLSPVLPFAEQQACLQLPYYPTFLPPLDLSHWSLRLWQVTSLSKDLMKQDIVLLINCYALTNQPLTCHTCHFMKQPRQTSMFRLPLYEYSEVSHSKWTDDKAKIQLFNIHICCYTMCWPQIQISMFTQGKTVLRKHTEWWRNKVCAVNITLSVTT